MKFRERLTYIVLPTSFFLGMGILQIKFPHAMDNFDDGYTGRGIAGVIMLFIELFLIFAWGKILGFISIFLGVIILVTCWWLTKPNDNTLEPATVNNSDLQTERRTFQVATDIALAYIEETSETEATSKTKEQSDRTSRLLGKAARSLAKKRSNKK